MPYILIPYPVPQPPPSITPMQIGLLVCQVLIAITTVVISKRYYDGMTKRGKESLELQKSDVHLKYKAEFEKTENRIRGVCDGAVSAAYAGVGDPPNPVLAIRLLRQARTDLADLEAPVRGVRNMTEAIAALRSLLGDYIESESREDPHEARVRLCGDVERSAKDLKRRWQIETSAVLGKLEPMLGELRPPIADR